jgi:hypothetical protein
MDFDENFYKTKIDAVPLLIKYHPEGKPEASICCVAKDSK